MDAKKTRLLIVQSEEEAQRIRDFLPDCDWLEIQVRRPTDRDLIREGMLISPSADRGDEDPAAYRKAA